MHLLDPLIIEVVPLVTSATLSIPHITYIFSTSKSATFIVLLYSKTTKISVCLSVISPYPFVIFTYLSVISLFLSVISQDPSNPDLLLTPQSLPSLPGSPQSTHLSLK